MAKGNLISILKSVQGKLAKGENVCCRKTVRGGTSIYVQEEHDYSSLHSPAQERNRVLLGLASISAKEIMADEVQRAEYERQWKASDGRYTSLQRFIVHLEYEKLKNENEDENENLPLA